MRITLRFRHRNLLISGVACLAAFTALYAVFGFPTTSLDTISGTLTEVSSRIQKQVTHPLKRNEYSLRRIEQRLNYELPYDPSSSIERNIWQIWITHRTTEPEFPGNCEQLVERWQDANKDWIRYMLSLDQALMLVEEQFRGVPEVLEALNMMPDLRLQWEFLKYLVTFAKGGLYADIDTIDIKPISHWESFTNDTRLLLGVVSDYNQEDWEDFFNRRMVLSNSIFMAKAHHPMLAKLIAKITYVSFTQQSAIQATNWTVAMDLSDVNGDPVNQFTGPSIFTDSVFDYLSERNPAEMAIDEEDLETQLALDIVGPKDGRLFSYRNVTGISRPVTVADTVIYPQISFNGFENSHNDMYDDNDKSTGYEAYYYGRPLRWTKWSHRKVRFDSN